jgi:hypothetical protein
MPHAILMFLPGTRGIGGVVFEIVEIVGRGQV